MKEFLLKGIQSSLPVLAIMLTMMLPDGAAAKTSAEKQSGIRIAGIVLKWRPQEKEINFKRVVPMIRQAAENDADIVCTTECFLDGYSINDKSIPLDDFRALGERIPGGHYFEQLRALADELDIYLVAGMLEQDGDQLFNTAVILSPGGELISKYHKQKLGHESPRITAGKASTVVETDEAEFGVMICADRTDSRIVQRFCSRGADFLICPSGGMFGPRKNDPIVQARSLENGKFIVFVHPAEFLVTRPDGTIAARTLLGDRLEIDDDEIGTFRDSSGVFYFDLPRSLTSPAGRVIEEQLEQRLLEPQTSWNELRTVVEASVPSVVPPQSVAEWKQTATKLREDFLAHVVYRGEAAQWRDAAPRVRWFETMAGGSDYRIRKLAYEALPGMWIPALLYEPTQLRGKLPVVLNVNGHHRGGKAMPYKQRRCINLAMRGILALNLEFLDMGQLYDQEGEDGNRHNRLVQIDLCGTSGLAPFYLTLTRGLDVALSHQHADPDRVAVTGLSGGGWQSIILAALDERITLANPVAGYCSLLARTARRNNIGDAEQIPTDMCSVADYTALTALVAPRPLLLTYNARDDCCFLPPDVLPQLTAAARPIYGLYGQVECFRTHINHDPGTHNFDADNRQALYRLLGDFFFSADDDFSTDDIPIPDEALKTAEQLAVPLPESNATLHSLALELSQSLPDCSALPDNPQQARSWHDSLRERLSQVIHVECFESVAEQIGKEQIGDATQVVHTCLRLDEKWTVPVTEFRPPQAQATVIVVADSGRNTTAGIIKQLLASEKRVVAVDLLGFGEANPRIRDGKNDDIALHLPATVGRRTLGIHVGQLAAVARWAGQGGPQSAAQVIAVGPRCCVVALATAALQGEAMNSVELHHCWGSLKELVWRDMLLEDAPELFCFGLLKAVDIPQLVALAAPRRVIVHDPSPDLSWRWSPLKSWHAMRGGELTLIAPPPAHAIVDPTSAGLND